MITTKDYKLPEEKQPELQKAVRLEWITFFYITSVVIVLGMVLSSSQAMKSAWFEDILALVPSGGFLIALAIYKKAPNTQFPYGFHRVWTVVHLVGSLALVGIATYLLIDSVLKLVHQEHPTIGSVFIFGHQVWFGWVMIAALFYSFLPAMVIGFLKMPLAESLHNKVLYTDSKAQKADYSTAAAAMAGILGIGMGWWWADAVAAIFIALSILRDGVKDCRSAMTDIMDRYPETIKKSKDDVLVDDIRQHVERMDWVEEARVRFRENGQVYFGEIFVQPKEWDDHLADHIEQTYEEVWALHWKIHDVVIVPVRSFHHDYPGGMVATQKNRQE